MNKLILPSLLFTLLFSCQSPQKEFTSFQDDVDFLRQYVDDLTVLKKGEALMAVSPSWQGRVFTTSLDGENGRSLGYYNQKLFKVGKADQQLSKAGGESRMWFGPEVGDFSIFFPPNVEQVGENMKVSADLDTLKFNTDETSNKQVIASNDMVIENAYGTSFTIHASRSIELFDVKTIEKNLGIQLQNGDKKSIGFETNTIIKNTGNTTWSKDTGLLPIWILGCFHPSEKQWAIVPTNSSELDTVTNYFTDQTGRVMIKKGVAFYKVDAGYLNKMGLPQKHIRPIMGSYSPEMNLLNIVVYSFDSDPNLLYVNSEWGKENNYDGDVMNIFNGEINLPLDRDWPFYEFESFSAAKELQPGEELQHKQSVYHFEGSKEELTPIAEQLLGVSLFDAPFN
ncbi:hypothetical protein KMW28_04295 [Flammeovirga yaeyamensis]|uniref:DUF4302 domain-containing protein n=1 Tax=Flammeovirga yaeyamensis TaxID=367791 RepID=A0AAX1N5Q8_9BACT|nr:DUF6786 family protein [Flammeovirga yaeyamensis]MBB3697376.1 hypothetical protein [Flammeovirga yaeyamensis]NMF36070.1 hypothetical protein [Flammeovirga yaeyamensis]QWG02805.1 hypothetical protein KMW28_04295 [Flammeovirga yaeyamensis]